MFIKHITGDTARPAAKLTELLQVTELRGLISDYAIKVRKNYMKNVLSLLVPHNDNSAIVTAGFCINGQVSDNTACAPLFFSKINFRELLLATIHQDNNTFKLKLLPYVTNVDDQDILHVRQIMYCNEQEIESPAEYAEIYIKLQEQLYKNAESIQADTLLERVVALRSVDFMEIVERLVDIDRAIINKICSFGMSHQLVQNKLIPDIQKYIEQIIENMPELPLPIAIATALDACLNKMLDRGGHAVRVIENITYLADRIYGQSITADKIGRQLQPVAIISEYITLEDLLCIIQANPMNRALTFISAWEPDFISQEDKRTNWQLRNDDTQELCQALGYGFYISYDTVGLFAGPQVKVPESLCILDGEAFRNNHWNRFTETFIVMNRPEKLVDFIQRYKDIFTFARSAADVLNADDFHDRNMELSDAYERVVRRYLTNSNIDQEDLMQYTRQSYRQKLEEIFDGIRPIKTRTRLLTESDMVSINKVIDHVLGVLMQNYEKIARLYL